MTRRAEQLQFIRFIAFIIIFLLHALWPQPSVFVNGAAAVVSFFFILSGFGSGYSSYEKEVECSVNAIRDYEVGKLKKIYPLYLVTLLVTLGYSIYELVVTSASASQVFHVLGRFVTHALLIQAWIPTEPFAFNGPTWFISALLFLYLFNRPMLWLFSKIKNKMWYVTIAFGVFLLVVVYNYFTRTTNMEYTQYLLPIARLGEYVGGCALGLFVAGASEQPEGYKTKKSVIALMTLLEVISLALWIGAWFGEAPSWEFRVVHWLPSNILLMVVFGIGKGLLSKLFRMRLFTILGSITMECYMVHYIIVRGLRKIFEMTSIGSDAIALNLFVAVLGLVLTIIAAFIWKEVEKKLH